MNVETLCETCGISTEIHILLGRHIISIWPIKLTLQNGAVQVLFIEESHAFFATLPFCRAEFLSNNMIVHLHNNL